MSGEDDVLGFEYDSGLFKPIFDETLDAQSAGCPGPEKCQGCYDIGGGRKLHPPVTREVRVKGWNDFK